MVPLSDLRAPYHSRTLARLDKTEWIDEVRLERASVLTQLGLLVLCVARACADRARGGFTVEGSLAVILIAILVIRLLIRAAHWAIDGGRGLA
jgi:hypothetical protein